MKKIILLLSIIILAFTSCSKSEEPIPAIVAQSLNLPKKIIYFSNSSDGNSENIVYNGNKIVEITNSPTAEPSKSVYTYTGDLITKTEYFENNVLESVEDYIYVNGKLTARFFWENRNNGQNTFTLYKDKSTFTYNASGTVVTEQIYRFENDAYVLGNNSNIYTYANGNLITEVANSSYTSSGNTSTNKNTYIYEYDTKNSPLKNILGLSKTGFNEELSGNNLTKRTTLSEGTFNGVPNITQPAVVRNFINAYNADNFLTESKYDFLYYLNTNPPTTETRTRTTQYVY